MPTIVEIPEDALASVRDKGTLFAFLRDYLHWPLDPEDTFTYQCDTPSGEKIPANLERLVPFSGDDPFIIMLAEFPAGFKRADLREILRGVRREMKSSGRYGNRGIEEIIFICTTPGSGGYQAVSFAHFRERAGRQPVLSVFGWDRDRIRETRTVREYNLPPLQAERNLLGLLDWDRLTVDRWLSAWNIELVTEKFYRDFHRFLSEAAEKITGIDGDAKMLFTQKLFDRLLFIRFIEKKGWLRLHDRQDYLRALWEAYDDARAAEDNFYRDRLKIVFFVGLNNPQRRDLGAISQGVLQDVIGIVPYLNGGLFNQEDDRELLIRYPELAVPDEAIRPFLDGLLYAYNFTVTESTPDDIEVAVDPEMLGKVFEELMNEVTGDTGDSRRHEIGAYYTPRPIVSFMCREALKGYLGGGEAIARFVDDGEADELPHPEEILRRLQEVRVCDPACGSGAYLLGMMQEIMRLRRLLFVSRRVDPRSDYQRKLEIIQQNLYGVDIEPAAVEIARLRLWLSLVVDSPDPVPLPNLDYKIGCGNSLTAPNPELPGATLFRHADVQEFTRLKAEYADPDYVGSKADLKRRIDDLRAAIARGEHERPVDGFDWRVEFAEVFDIENTSRRGFDVILANPPYVRHELIRDQKPKLREIYNNLFCGTADLYVFFYYRALQLLKRDGMLVFISSNKWLRTGYGAKLRAHIASSMCVKSITDFGDLPVFQSATAYPMIIVAQKVNRQNGLIFTAVPSLDDPYPDVPAILATFGAELPSEAISESDWKLTDPSSIIRFRRMSSAGTPLTKYVKEELYSGIKTGMNDAFIIDDRKRTELVTADPRSAEIIKPLITGKDIRKWLAQPHGQWLIVTPIGVDIKRYPAIFAHLTQWKTELETRCDQGNYWWELRPCDYYNAFSKPKIVFPDIAKESRFSFDTSGAFLGNTAYIIPLTDLYLLGILNSQVVLDFYLELSSQVRGGYLRFIRQYVEQIPVPDAPEAERTTIATLVQKCLDARGVGCAAWEAEINEHVASLYGLSPASNLVSAPTSAPRQICTKNASPHDDIFQELAKLARLQYRDDVNVEHSDLVPIECLVHLEDSGLLDRQVIDEDFPEYREYLNEHEGELVDIRRVVLPITELLGEYIAGKHLIVIYDRVVEAVAKSLKITASQLELVVLYHEAAHAVTHLGIDEDGGIWDIFTEADPIDKELFAQFYTLKCFQDQSDHSSEHAFRLLANGQPSIYNSWHSLENASIQKIHDELIIARRKPRCQNLVTRKRIFLKQPAANIPVQKNTSKHFPADFRIELRTWGGTLCNVTDSYLILPDGHIYHAYDKPFDIDSFINHVVPEDFIDIDSGCIMPAKYKDSIKLPRIVSEDMILEIYNIFLDLKDIPSQTFPCKYHILDAGNHTLTFWYENQCNEWKFPAAADLGNNEIQFTELYSLINEAVNLAK